MQRRTLIGSLLAALATAFRPTAKEPVATGEISYALIDHVVVEHRPGEFRVEAWMNMGDETYGRAFDIPAPDAFSMLPGMLITPEAIAKGEKPTILMPLPIQRYPVDREAYYKARLDIEARKVPED